MTADTHFDGERLREVFDAPEPGTIGIEEEVMLLDPETKDLAPVAPAVLARLADDPRFKAELPASQIEIVIEPARSASEAVSALAAARVDLAAACTGLALPAVAGVHPFADLEGELTALDRYTAIRREYGPIARRQLVAALQIHVALGDASRALGAYNAMRERLPEVAAVAANARFHDGRDSGLASVRPVIAENLPRQGMPPAIESWSDFAEDLRWGHVAGILPDARLWWWELRPNPAFGTIEVRVPDAQTTIADAIGVAGFVQALVGWLGERDPPKTPAKAWRLGENRWSAARHGVEGAMADLATGEPEPTRERLHRLLDEIEPGADDPGPLREARRLVERNGSIRQREVAADLGIPGLTHWLAEHFLDRC